MEEFFSVLYPAAILVMLLEVFVPAIEMTGHDWDGSYPGLIKKVVMDDGVTSIAERAFYNINSLEELEIGNSVGIDRTPSTLNLPFIPPWDFRL